MLIRNITASQSTVDAPLAGGEVPYLATRDVPDEDAVKLIASGHFEAAEPATPDTLED